MIFRFAAAWAPSPAASGLHDGSPVRRRRGRPMVSRPRLTRSPQARAYHAAPLPMSKEAQLRQVLDCGIVAVVRSPDSSELVEVARALADGGVSVVEITMTVPDALDVLRRVRGALGDRLLLG